jgi:hypothetical protein
VFSLREARVDLEHEQMTASLLTHDPERFPLPFLLHYLEPVSERDDDLTISETPYQTGPDGPTHTDYLDDEDISGGAPTNTGQRADSNPQEDVEGWW